MDAEPLQPVAALIIGGLAIGGLVLFWALTAALMRVARHIEDRKDRR